MSIPTIGDAISRILGVPLSMFWAFLDAIGAAIKAEVPDAGPAVDQAIADAKAKAEAFLNAAFSLSKVTDAIAQLKEFLATGQSEAPPDPGDVVG